MSEHAKRIVYRVRWAPTGAWHLMRDGESVEYFTLKKNAVQAGAGLARDLRESEGTPTLLVVHNKNGRIAFERTYGCDPEKSPG